jgi:hypothetical protein
LPGACEISLYYILFLFVIRNEKEGKLVAHACNPSYSGGRDQGDRGLKPAQANSSGDPVSKILITKKGRQIGST